MYWPADFLQAGGMVRTNMINSTFPLSAWLSAITMDYFAAVRAFMHAAELQSFSKTAQEMAVKTSTVSRYVSELEKDLGIALFNRSTRGLVLTEGGRVFREHAAQALAALDAARQATS